MQRHEWPSFWICNVSGIPWAIVFERFVVKNMIFWFFSGSFFFSGNSSADQASKPFFLLVVPLLPLIKNCWGTGGACHCFTRSQIPDVYSQIPDVGRSSLYPFYLLSWTCCLQFSKPGPLSLGVAQFRTVLVVVVEIVPLLPPDSILSLIQAWIFLIWWGFKCLQGRATIWEFFQAWHRLPLGIPVAVGAFRLPCITLRYQ